MHRAPQPDRLGVTGGPWRQWHQNLFGLPQGLNLVRHLRLVGGECQMMYGSFGCIFCNALRNAITGIQSMNSFTSAFALRKLSISSAKRSLLTGGTTEARATMAASLRHGT